MFESKQDLVEISLSTRQFDSLVESPKVDADSVVQAVRKKRKEKKTAGESTADQSSVT